MRFGKEGIDLSPPTYIDGIDLRDLLKPYDRNDPMRKYTNQELEEMLGDVIKFTAYAYCKAVGKDFVEEGLLHDICSLVWHELRLPPI